MSLKETVITGTLQPDGALVLDEKPNLPPGRVQIHVQVLPELPKNDPFWQRMQTIWETQKAGGCTPRSVEEVETERRQVRDEWDERMQRMEQLQAEAMTLSHTRKEAT